MSVAGWDDRHPHDRHPHDRHPHDRHPHDRRCARATLAEVELPVSWRPAVHEIVFGKLYGAEMDKARYPLESYASLQDFFCRSLDADAVRIDERAVLTSPVQARVVALGEVGEENARVKQVKHTNYNVKSFLGKEPFDADKKTRTKYCVLYLAPGDYHRFHSPCDSFKVDLGRHFSGEVLPVSEFLIEKLSLGDLFSVNERVVLSGGSAVLREGGLGCALPPSVV